MAISRWSIANACHRQCKMSRICGNEAGLRRNSSRCLAKHRPNSIGSQDAHARRVCSERFFGLAAPIRGYGGQIDQPLVALELVAARDDKNYVPQTNVFEFPALTALWCRMTRPRVK